MATIEKISLNEIVHDGPHDEENVYGEDYTFVFKAGSIDTPSTYRSALVLVRALPEREYGYKVHLSALWSFPPVTESRNSKQLESSEPIVFQDIQVAATGLVSAIEELSEDEIRTVHDRFRQAELIRGED